MYYEYAEIRPPLHPISVTRVSTTTVCVRAFFCENIADPVASLFSTGRFLRFQLLLFFPLVFPKSVRFGLFVAIPLPRPPPLVRPVPKCTKLVNNRRLRPNRVDDRFGPRIEIPQDAAIFTKRISPFVPVRQGNFPG